ncbi:IS1 family transposase [uncultured Photobacterium sp.]|uniref:IS1 family transposase n=1 Tax=uncultured Photobacterium sp. TaxID=173973 RepID=UPI00260EB71E|nr:IS1 family transposase [uncultured Photobacterium sp.]
MQNSIDCDFRVYSSNPPLEKHITGKLFTQRIERQNLTLRTRLKRLNRKTIGFSRSEGRVRVYLLNSKGFLWGFLFLSIQHDFIN